MTIYYDQYRDKFVTDEEKRIDCCVEQIEKMISTDDWLKGKLTVQFCYKSNAMIAMRGTESVLMMDNYMFFGNAGERYQAVLDFMKLAKENFINGQAIN